MKKTILNVLLASFITTNLITTITSATVLDENKISNMILILL